MDRPIDPAWRERLRDRLERALGPTPTWHVERFGDGRTNEMFLVEWNGVSYVLKQAPAREPVPGLLHDVIREYELMSALSGTGVPVPAVVFACRDSSVLGTESYLMEFVPGDNPVDGVPPRFRSAAGRTGLGHAVIDTLAKLHSLDPQTVDIGIEAPGNDLDRAVEEYGARIDRALERTGDRRPLTHARRVGDWLRENVPETEDVAVVHGDYKPKNLVFRAAAPPVVDAVVDWEMGGIGTPQTDLGWLTGYFWPESRDPSPATAGFEAKFGASRHYDAAVRYLEEYASFSTHEQIPSRKTLVERYETRTGIEFAHDRFYRALALYKLIGILESFFAASLDHPDDVDDKYEMMEVLSPLVARKATRIIEGAHPL